MSAFLRMHGHNTSKYLVGTIYLLVVINSLSSFPIYAMPVFDNLESNYTVKKKKKQCPRQVRTGLRLFFGVVVFLVALAFPFLGSLATVIGGITLPLTFVYPCSCTFPSKKPRPNGAIWWVNLVLDCIGSILSVMLVVAAAWNLCDKGLNANFFRP